MNIIKLQGDKEKKNGAVKNDLLNDKTCEYDNIFILYSDSTTYETSEYTQTVLNTSSGGKGVYITNGKSTEIKQDMPTHQEAIELVLKALVNEEYGVLKSMSEIDAVGHRVLHSGEDFTGPALATEENIEKCLANAELGPLHQIPNIAGVKACKEVILRGMELLKNTFHLGMKKN